MEFDLSNLFWSFVVAVCVTIMAIAIMLVVRAVKSIPDHKSEGSR